MTSPELVCSEPQLHAGEQTPADIDGLERVVDAGCTW